MEGSEAIRIVMEELKITDHALTNQFNKATSLKEKQEFLNQLKLVDDIRFRVLDRLLKELGTIVSDFLKSINEKELTGVVK